MSEAEVAEIKAQAMDDAAKACDDDGSEEMTSLINWLKGRADEYRKGYLK